MKKSFSCLLAAAMCLSLAACSAKPAESGAANQSDLAYIQDKGSLIVGITEFEPMDFQDANGNWIGFDADMAKAFAESLGGPESLITLPATQTHADVSPEEREKLGITDSLLRMSVGLEHVNDLIADLEQAMA